MTRLHVRYDAQSFPEDLNFIETSDHESFQARYVLHRPYEGGSCPAARNLPRLASGDDSRKRLRIWLISQAGRKRTSRRAWRRAANPSQAQSEQSRLITSERI